MQRKFTGKSPCSQCEKFSGSRLVVGPVVGGKSGKLGVLADSVT